MALRSPKDAAFYKLLDQQAEKAFEAATAFNELASDFSKIESIAEAIDEIEHQADILTHELTDRVWATFITPLDKEDFRDLSQALDDITDCIEAAVARALLYRLNETRPDLPPLTKLLVQATDETRKAVAMLREGIKKPDAIRTVLIRIHEVENESDKAFRQALADLFHENGQDALTVIKWKEIYDRIETAIDKCEDVAKIIGSVLVKYA